MSTPRPQRYLALTALLLTTLAVRAQSDGAMSLTVPDTLLHDQNGKPVHVYSDLIRGNAVVMNFIFTSCTTICSPMGANFGALQSQIGPDVRLISITIDPTVDTPARLKRWSAQFHAGASWTLLTGSREDVEGVLKALGAYTPNRFSHAPLLLVGDGRSNRWIRANGLMAPREVVRLIGLTRAPASSAEVSRR
jgi:protein SCO1